MSIIFLKPSEKISFGRHTRSTTVPQIPAGLKSRLSDFVWTTIANMKFLTSKWFLLATLSAILAGLLLYGIQVCDRAKRQLRLETRDQWVARQLESLRSGNSYVSLYSCENTDFMLQSMAGMPEVESIFIKQTDLSDTGLSQLNSLPNLHCLEISGQTKLSDDSIIAITKCVSLRKLRIFGPSRISDDGIASLAKVRTLGLFEHSGQFSKAAIQTLGSSLENLTIDQPVDW